MKTENPKPTPRDAGFSLIELMVVILIMGVLATTIMLSLAPVGDQSRITKVRADLAAFDTALEMYNLDMASYPDSQSGLNALKTPPANANQALYRTGGYIKQLRDDPWGKPYNFEAPGRRSGLAYDVYSAGPDMVPGNQDDIGNW
jgi:general secretion pathway protein G